MRLATCFFVALCGFTSLALAYNEPTHKILSEKAIDTSDLGKPAVLGDLGLKPSIREEGERFLNSLGIAKTIRELVADGAQFEDTGLRSINHFFDPVNDKGLFVTSPTWALEDTKTAALQKYSFRDGRDYFYKALTQGSEQERRKNFGLMFETLGRITHHVQDMAQPQHTRLDYHLKLDWTNEQLPFENRSRYEAYTDEQRTKLPFSAPAYWPEQSVVFRKPRDFWAAGDGTGLAAFTNSNFVSAGTNFQVKNGQVAANARYALPSPEDVLPPVPIEQVYAEAGKPYPVEIKAECQDKGRDCRMTFVTTKVQDIKFNFVRNNNRTATYSIFDQDMRMFDAEATYTDPATGQLIVSGRAFSLNEFNFDEAHKFLIPRAVAYSAGLINYFFRGKIDIVPDAQNAGGYRIKNLGTEPIAGKFVLYYDAADGTRKAVPDVNGTALVWDTRVILASSNNGVLGPNSDMPVTGFVPPADAKRPGEYMLVFSGDMGEEKSDEANGVVGAVAAKFIRPEIVGMLYLLVHDTSGNKLTLRADKDGTRLVAPSEFNPFASSSVPANGLPKAAVMKQVVFSQNAQGQSSYKVVALNMANSAGYVYDEEAKDYRQVSARTWVARSPDPQIGEFEFTPDLFTSTDARLLYARRYTDSAGVPQARTGAMQLPRLPFSVPVNYSGFFSGTLFISPDGLTITGFRHNLSTGEATYPKIRITLGAVPLAALDETDREKYTRTDTQSESSHEDGTPFSVPCVSDPGVAYGHNYEMTAYISSINERRYIDYFNGALATYRVTQDTISRRVSDLTGTEFSVYTSVMSKK